jgi:hypothetical protein
MTPADRAALDQLLARATELRSGTLTPGECDRKTREWHRRYVEVSRSIIASDDFDNEAMEAVGEVATWGPEPQ